ncbi:MAG: DUF427 domain-containing protein [Pseudomonadota bacterium]
MPEIRITPATGTVVVRAGGAVIAESMSALMLEEGDYDPVFYIPRGDIGMTFLEPSATRTTCPHKGEASHFDLVAKSGPIRDAAWSYETPHDAVASIAGMIAFYPNKAAVEVL